MPITEYQIKLVTSIDRIVTEAIELEGGERELFIVFHDHLDTYREILRISTHQELDELAQRYVGFKKLSVLMEKLLRALADMWAQYRLHCDDKAS